MKRSISVFIFAISVFIIPTYLFSQTNPNAYMQEFGITAGAFTNFPANRDFLPKNINVFYIAPYIRTGKHEFTAGVVYPLNTNSLFNNSNSIYSCPGAIAGYKYYIFNMYNNENIYLHYSFQYLRFKENYDVYPFSSTYPNPWTEKDNYINNVFGIGYMLFFDKDQRFSFYYNLDYVISQTGYKVEFPGAINDTWKTKYIWNNLSTHVGFSFKLTSLKKKDKK